MTCIIKRMILRDKKRLKPWHKPCLQNKEYEGFISQVTRNIQFKCW